MIDVQNEKYCRVKTKRCGAGVVALHDLSAGGAHTVCKHIMVFFMHIAHRPGTRPIARRTAVRRIAGYSRRAVLSSAPPPRHRRGHPPSRWRRSAPTAGTPSSGCRTASTCMTASTHGCLSKPDPPQGERQFGGCLGAVGRIDQL